MTDKTHIEAVTVNHNSSLFTELALRSLFATHGPDLSISATVMDSESTDTDDLRVLSEYLRDQDIPLKQTGFGSNRKHPGDVNTHGEILRSFVLGHPDCSHYLFMDPDICFIAPDTLNTMLAELAADPMAFGIVARFTLDGETEFVIGEGDSQKQKPFHFMHAMRTEDGKELSLGQFDAERRNRIHPFCALVRNTPVFRSIVEEIGLSCTFVKAEKCGMYFDTLSLLTAVMRTHGFRHLLSSAMVIHFFSVTYDKEWIADKRQRCLGLLQPLRRNEKDSEQPSEPYK